MEFEFEYNAQKMFMTSLEVADIGNMSVRCSGYYIYKKLKFPAEYYMVTKTTAGMVGILLFGPILPDMEDNLADTFNLSFLKTDYKESVIIKNINTFLNDPLKGITEAEEIPLGEIQELIPDFSNYFKGEF